MAITDAKLKPFETKGPKKKKWISEVISKWMALWGWGDPVFNKWRTLTLTLENTWYFHFLSFCFSLLTISNIIWSVLYLIMLLFKGKMGFKCFPSRLPENPQIPYDMWFHLETRKQTLNSLLSLTDSNSVVVHDDRRSGNRSRSDAFVLDILIS